MQRTHSKNAERTNSIVAVVVFVVTNTMKLVLWIRMRLNYNRLHEFNNPNGENM